MTNKDAIALFNTSNNITKVEKMEATSKNYKENLEIMKQYRKEQQKENKLLKTVK